MKKLNALYRKMISYDQGDPKRIQHFAKVHSFAKLIGEEEHLEEHTQFLLEAAALVHDIGIKKSMEKYGDSSGKHQEQEGPAEVEKMLEELHFDKQDIERISFLVGHHHTYQNMEGLDYQILVEADFLVNDYENQLSKETIQANVKKIFKTETGKRLAEEMFYPQTFQLSETWAQDALQDLDDYIEEQGIYLRQ